MRALQVADRALDASREAGGRAVVGLAVRADELPGVRADSSRALGDRSRSTWRRSRPEATTRRRPEAVVDVERGADRERNGSLGALEDASRAMPDVRA
jgi:hypothetical protein